MDFKELKNKKQELEQDLSRVIYQKINDFKKTTGVWPDNVSVWLNHLAQLGHKDYVDVLVETKVKIEV